LVDCIYEIDEIYYDYYSSKSYTEYMQDEKKRKTLKHIIESSIKHTKNKVIPLKYDKTHVAKTVDYL